MLNKQDKLVLKTNSNLKFKYLLPFEFDFTKCFMDCAQIQREISDVAIRLYKKTQDKEFYEHAKYFRKEAEYLSD